MTLSSSARRADARGRYYPWIFVGGFLAVIAVNAVMVGLALASFSGIETPRHYAQGLAYNRLIEADRAQHALGWRIELGLLPRAADPAQDARTVALEVDAADKLGRPLDNLELRALAVRPTSAGFDRELRLTPAGGGRYRATLELPLPGQWDLRLVANRADAHWQTVRRLNLP